MASPSSTSSAALAVAAAKPFFMALLNAAKFSFAEDRRCATSGLRRACATALDALTASRCASTPPASATQRASTSKASRSPGSAMGFEVPSKDRSPASAVNSCSRSAWPRRPPCATMRHAASRTFASRGVLRCFSARQTSSTSPCGGHLSPSSSTPVASVCSSCATSKRPAPWNFVRHSCAIVMCLFSCAVAAWNSGILFSAAAMSETVMSDPAPFCSLAAPLFTERNSATRLRKASITRATCSWRISTHKASFSVSMATSGALTLRLSPVYSTQ
mmetsp:Transcript_20307/g.68850  ORF Transcript_20307/g.68850 Transcript_20307/m.68850 type:complete len:275 (+) Transcript_20307:531-1355(+)